MNMLSLDEHRVFVEASETHQIQQVKDLGLTPIPVPMRHAYTFGGGLHCCTGDVYRDSKNECFFADVNDKFLSEEIDYATDCSTRAAEPGELAVETAALLGRSRYRTTDSPDYGFKDNRVYENC